MKSFIAAVLLTLSVLSVSGQPGVQTDVGYKEVNGTSLYYMTLGEGEPILVVHGGPGLGHDYLRDPLYPLAKDYKLIFYDQRVSGRSSLEVDSNHITLNHFIEDIEGLRKAFGIEKVNLMAHSWGGLLAMKYAATYPDRVKSLILLNSTAASSEISDKANEQLAAQLTEEDIRLRNQIVSQASLTGNLTTEAIEQLMMIGFKYQFYDSANVKKLQLNLNENYAETARLLQFLGPDLYEYDIHADLKKISAPTYLIYGESDPLWNTAGKKLEKAIPKAEMIVFESSGHFPFIEEQETFYWVVREFLER